MAGVTGIIIVLLIPFASAALPVPSIGSDLAVEEIAAPLHASPGYPYLINATIRNTGHPSGLVTLGFYLSPDLNLTPDDRLLWTESLDPVPEGKREEISSEETLPRNISPGGYYLIAYLQDLSGDEMNVQNNAAYLTEKVQVTERPLPDQNEFNAKTAEIIFNLTNEERKSRSMAPLIWDQALADIGRGHTDSMAEGSYFSHIDPEGRTAKERAEAAGYPTTKQITGGERVGIAENLAYVSSGRVTQYGYVDPTDPASVAREIMDGWMKSIGHRNNILDPLADRMGVSISYNGQYYYAAEEFY